MRKVQIVCDCCKNYIDYTNLTEFKAKNDFKAIKVFIEIEKDSKEQVAISENHLCDNCLQLAKKELQAALKSSKYFFLGRR